MRIESFWAKGFRSLRDVRLDNLGPFNVFYGPNGSGKSNILAAIDAWLRLSMITLDRGLSRDVSGDLRGERAKGKLALEGAGAAVHPSDFALASERRRMFLGGELSDVSPALKRVKIDVEVDATVQSRPLLVRGELVINDLPIDVEEAQPTPNHDLRLAALREVDLSRTFSLVPADRMPRAEAGSTRPPESEEPLSWYFRGGHLKHALFAAHNTTSPATRLALDRFRQLMAGPPLHRPAFRSVEDPHTGIRDLQERLPPPLDAYEVSLDLAGLGIAQIYWILGQAMLSGARAIGIEEPEAHLHAPTSGRDLRHLLERLVNEKHIDQLFIATHSNLFDLDPKEYLDVSLKNGETVVERADLTRIDRDHLYEPGPAKHGLQRMLEYMPREEIVFRRADGSGITADEMLLLLQEGDDLAVRFLEDLHGAAMRMVRVGAKKKAG